MLINWLKKIGIVLVELAVIAGLLSYIYQKKGSPELSQIVPALQELVTSSATELLPKEPEKPFPMLQQPVSRVFNWEYRGTEYSIDEKLYQSTYEYYKSEPKAYSYVGDIKPSWEEEYYGMFLKSNIEDKSIAQLAVELQTLGKKHELSDDQIVDLTLAFVQSIQYDDAKAKNILAQTGGETILYPYEILYEQIGVCSDKSLLATALLREMGYGVAIFAYEQDNHMAIGVQCPKSLSTYGSGYCFAETTGVGNKIGIIPTFDSTSNKTVGAKELSAFESNQAQQAKLQQLGQVTIYQATTGKEYGGIVETKKVMIEIDNLKKSIETLLPQLQTQKKAIAKEESRLAEMKKILENYQDGQSVEKYNTLVSEYNDFLKSYKKDVKKHNESVGLYNKTIQRYNTLIKQ